MLKFHSDASDTNETLTDVLFRDMGWQRRTNDWHEGNANFIVHRIRCDIREIGEFWNAVVMLGTCRDEIVKEIRSINSVQGSSGKSSMLSGIPEKRLNAGRKRVSGCAWAVRGFEPSGDGRARRALESGGYENDEHNRHDRPTHRFARTGRACFSTGDRTAPSSFSS